MRIPIIERKEVAENTFEFSFDLGENVFNFKAGQYINLTLFELVSPDLKGNNRNFSIVSHSSAKKIVRIAFRKSESGFKKSILEASIGSMVNIEGPFGTFVLPESSERPIVFVAGGIGITPFMSMIGFATEMNLEHKITLLYANNEEKSTAYLAELVDYASRNPRFTIERHYGPADSEFLEKYITENKNSLWFVAGSPTMTASVRSALISAKIDETFIHTEDFIGYGDDTTEFTGSENQLNEEVSLATERLQMLSKALNDVAIVSETDTQGNIVNVNDKFAEISKYTREELIGKNHRILKSGYHQPQLYEDLWSTISQGKSWHGEIRNRAKDGTFYWVDSNISPLFDKNGVIRGYIGIRFPITERKAMEDTAKAYQKDLEKTNKLMVGRELRMIELKKEIAMLKKELGRSEPVKTDSLDI